MYDIVLSYGLPGTFLLITLGMAVLIGGGEVLIRGASRLAVAMKISPLLVGLTVVAFCTSAPELAVSLNAAMAGKADIAVGNVVGSNICNICLILGISAVLRPISVSSSLIRREIPLLVFLSILTYAFAISGGDGFFSLFEGDYEGRLSRGEGVVFLLGLMGYMLWTVYEVRRHRRENEKYIEEIEEEVSTQETGPDEKIVGIGNLVVNCCYLIIGIAMLVAGSDMLVQGGVGVARLFGISELVIGLTVLATGTSLPELVVSVLAAMQGKSDIAVGNVVGSNIFNLLGVLGPTTLLSPGGLSVASKVLQFDIPFMLLITVCCILICITGRKVSRGEGLFLLACYAFYIGLLCFFETG